MIAILQSGPWPLPRPPEQAWASDATRTKIAVVDNKGHTQVAWPMTARHIYVNGMRAALWTAMLAPRHIRLFCDNTVVVGATRRSRHYWAATVWLSWLLVAEDLMIRYIPTNCNPADEPSRNHLNILTPTLQVVQETLPIAEELWNSPS